MEVERIDHIHYKTHNRERDTRLFERLLGKKPLFDADFKEYGIRDVFYAFPHVGFQLVEVTDKDGISGPIFDELPEGICGIALKVPDIETAIAEMESMGYKKLYQHDFSPVKEAGFDAREDFGIYIELIEFPGESIQAIFEQVLPKVQKGDQK